MYSVPFLSQEAKLLFPIYFTLCTTFCIVFCSCSGEVFCFYRAVVKVLYSYCSIIKLLFEKRVKVLALCKTKHCSLTWARSSFGVFSFCVTVFYYFQHSETNLDPLKLLLLSIVLTLPKHCLLIRF